MQMVYFEDQEVWSDLECRDIRKDMYEISTFGNIKNKITGQILKPRLINSGYMVTNLRVDNPDRKACNYLNHRLVAETFIPEWRTEGTNTVNHDNSNKGYNNVTNLEWMSQKENNDHKYKNGLDNTTGEKAYNAHFTDEQVHSICKMLEQGDMTYRQILNSIGLYPKSSNDLLFDYIGNIKRKKAWRHISQYYNI